MTPEEWGAKLAQAVKNGLPQQCRVVEVTAVDTATWTATVLPVDSDAELHDVRLRASGDGAELGVLVVPKVGTTALLQLIGNDPNLAYLTQVDQAERVLVRGTGGGWLEVTGAGLKLNGDQFGELVKLPDLVHELNKNNQLLAALLAVINTAPIPEAGNGAPSALQLAMKNAVAGKLLGDFSNLGNPNVTHG